MSPKKCKCILVVFVIYLLVSSIPTTFTSASESALDPVLYLPYIVSPGSAIRRVNIPYFGQDDVRGLHYGEMAIFWLGKVAPPQNYADVRIAYNDIGIALSISMFDRRLWYDPSPSPDDLSLYDSVTIYLSKGQTLDPNAYRFTAQLNDWEENRARWQLAEQGSGGAWVTSVVPFTSSTGIRWEDDPGGMNNDTNNRGSVINLSIPFTSLGIIAPPAQGTIWYFAMVMHDRDDAGGNSILHTPWPETLQTSQPLTWGRLAFGIPAFTPPVTPEKGRITIRHQLNGAVVPDAALGGTTGNLCRDDPNYIWYQWGNDNFGQAADFNIQNQSDLADFPCFSKYYIQFPLNSIPANKVILSATLTLFHWGNSGTATLAKPSNIHVYSIKESWDESTINWNNAPLAQENVSFAIVNPAPPCGGKDELDWPCTPRSWDLSRAVAQAYQRGAPLNLAFYASDSDYHSGKFFTTSNTADWNEDGRPTLVVTWGNP